MTHEYFGKQVSRLGFGLMRLPKLPGGAIDVEQVKEMADLFLEAGGTYFDTAYVYDGGESEKAFGKAVVERHPRESFTICTKLNAGHGCPDEETAKKQFGISLERTGAGYFDFYLLHAIRPESLKKYDEFGIWDFVRDKKEKGLVKHWGFSFHSTPEDLEMVLDKHPDVDFVQLQINYADWENPDVRSGECYRIAREHGKPIVVMEPVKGGFLAKLPKNVQAVFDETGSSASTASWAVRYVASLDGIMTVLSGMSSVAQMKDNLSYMKDFKPLTEDEYKVIAKAQEALKEDISIKCTACHYCTDGCPMNIPIPEIFALYNKFRQTYMAPPAKMAYRAATKDRGRASDCVSCGQCMAECPQNLEIPSLLKECTDLE